MKTFIVLASLFLSAAAGAAQEGYTTPAPRPLPPTPGASITHGYQCTIPQRSGHPIVGVRYALQVSTAALAPQYDVTGAALQYAAVVPHPVWTSIPLKATAQDESYAQFDGSNVTVKIDKADNFSATVEFTGGTIMTCKMTN